MIHAEASVKDEIANRVVRDNKVENCRPCGKGLASI